MNIEEKRKTIGYCLAVITGAKERITNFQSTEDDLKRLGKINSAIDKINELINGVSEEELQNVLGGEFSKDYVNGHPFESLSEKIPAYFLLDVASGVINKQCSNIEELKDITKTTLAKLKQLSDKAKKLTYEPLFNPDKTIPNDFIEILAKKGHDYSLTVKVKGDIRYLELRIDTFKESVGSRYGEYYTTNIYRQHNKKPLYIEDAKALEERKENIIQERLGILRTVVGKYFKDGIIPWLDQFSENLLDKDLDQRLKGLLIILSGIKTESGSDRGIVDSIVHFGYIKQIENVEQIIKKENLQREEEKTNAINAARERYQSKSKLWRFFHKRQNINIFDLDNMSIEDINGLYSEPGRKK